MGKYKYLIAVPVLIIVVILFVFSRDDKNGILNFVKRADSSHAVACQPGDTRPECDINKINTLGWEDSPYISDDGNFFYFMYTPWNMWPVFFGGSPEKNGPDRPGHHTNPNPWEDSDVYVTMRQPDGSWLAPQNHGSNDSRINCCQTTSPDQSIIAFQRNVNPPDTPGNNDLVLSVYNPGNGTWSAPVAFGSQINSSYLEDNPHLSPNGETIYFTSDRPGGYGGKDIWASFIDPTTGEWVQAFNMGPKFNTSADEDQIWVSDDGNTAYFNRGGIQGILKTKQNVRGLWSMPTVERFGSSSTDIIAEVSFANFGQPNVEAYYMLLSFDVQDAVVVKTKLGSDGKWIAPIPFDAAF